MLFYLIVLFVAAVLAYLARKSNGPISIFFHVASFFALLLPAMIRFGIGTDYLPIYLDGILACQDGNNLHNWEFGFVQFVNFCNAISDSPQLVFAAASFLTYFLVFLAFERRDWFVALLGYVPACYFAAYNVVRQELAISFMILALMLYQKGGRHYLVSILLIIVASLFHYSALMIVPYFIAVRLCDKFEESQLICLFLVAASVLTIFPVGFDQLAAVPFIDRYFERYVVSDYANSSVRSTGIGILWQNVIYFLCMISLVFNKNGDVATRRIGCWCGVAMVNRCLGVNVVILERTMFYTDAILPVALVYMSKEKSKKGRIILVVVGLMLVIMFARDYILPDMLGNPVPHEITPYQVFFDRM